MNFSQPFMKQVLWNLCSSKQSVEPIKKDLPEP